jgi:hypothetical protein
MNYYESVVIDYLRADRALFVNTECCIQLNPGDNPDNTGPHWYCDAIAADFRNRCVFLCEISYSRTLADLVKRLSGWHDNWAALKVGLRRDSHLPLDWDIRPWCFVPETHVPLLTRKLSAIGMLAFQPRITPLEMVQPWKYRSWNRMGEIEKPEVVPEGMRL